MYVILVAVISVAFQQASGTLLGKVIWKENENNVAGKLTILYNPHPLELTSKAGPVPLEEISSIFSLALGFSVFKDLTWHGLLSGNPFARPRALLTFVVNDIPSEAKLQQHGTSSFKIVSGTHSSSSADVMTLESGKTLANHIASNFDGKSLTVSVGASEEIASTGHSDSANRATVFYDEKNGNWKYLQGADLHEIEQITLDKVIRGEKERLKLNDIRLSVNGNRLALKTFDGTVSFDLSKQEIRNFFNEIAAILLMSEKALEQESLVADGISDVFSFFVTTCKGVSKIYGEQSSEMKAALKLVEAVIEKVTKKYKKAYGNNILIALVTLTERSLYTDDEVNSVYSKLKTSVKGLAYNKFHEEFPRLHFLEGVEERARQALCKSVKGALASFSGDVKFKCANDDERLHQLRKRSLLASIVSKDPTKNSTSDVNLASYYDPDFPVIFNIWFWLFVILALAIYIVSLSMWYMDPGKDSIIYRMTSQRIKTD